MKMRDSHYQLKMIAVLNFLILTLGLVGAAGIEKFFGLGLRDTGKAPGGHPAVLSLAVAGIALITFFGVLRIGRSTALPSEGYIRRAITLTVVTVYIVLVSIVAFYVPWAEETSDVSKTLLTSFTATMGVIVVFFFGSSAYVEAHTKKKQEESETSQPKDDA